MLLLPFVVGTVRGVQDAGFRPVPLALGALWRGGWRAGAAAVPPVARTSSTPSTPCEAIE